MSTLNKKIIGFSRKYKDALGMLKRSRTNMESMSAAVLFIPDQSEITHLETADYRGSILTLIRSIIFSRIFYSALDQFLSDVGGAAGLVLGVSLATLVGFLDCCLVSFFRFFHLRKDLVIYRFLHSITEFQ